MAICVGRKIALVHLECGRALGNMVSLAADLQIVGPYTTAQLAPSRNPCFGHDMSIKAIFIDMFSRHVVAIDISA
jgi:hypothetical protein